VSAKKLEVLAIGDSHIRVLEHPLFRLFWNKIHFNIVYVPGATAYGIGNMYSKTKAYTIFKDALEKHNYDKIIITLGEVDTAYTLWSIAKRDKKSINEKLKEAINRYKKFIDELVEYAPVFVISASLPTISDVAECNDSIQGIRKKVNISQRSRTLLALSFNRNIKEYCKSKDGVTFIDFTPYTLDFKRKKVKSWLLNRKNSCDHHYSRWVYALLILWKLSRKI